MKDSNAVHMALRTRAITATGFPAAAQRAYEIVNFTPTSGTQYVRDEFAPATSAIVTAPASTGTARDDGMYFVTVFGPLGEVARVAIRALADAIVAALSAAWSTVLSNGDRIRIRSKPVAPKAGQVLPAGNGWAYCQVAIPWEVDSVNAVLP